MSNTNHDFLVKNGLVVGQAITSTGTLTQAGQTFPASDGSAGQYLKTNGSGALSWGTVSTSFNITDGTTTDTVGLTETVTFTGGTNISLAVTDNTVTITNDVVDSDDITEGSSNLFYTDARAIAAIQGASNLTIDGGTLYVDTAADRVGISDTSPQQKLDVAGNIGVNGSEVIDASGNIVGSVADSAMTVGGSLAGVLSNLKVQYGTSYSGTPIQGSFFFDSLNQKLKVYTGSAFIDAVPAGSGGGGGGGATDANTTFRNYSYTLTGTTSAVSGVDDNELTAGAFIVGHKYTITSVGNTDFTAIGASGNTVGVVFTATGVGSGTGQAKSTLFYDTTSSTTRVVAYVNGIKQVYGSGRDFVATTGTSVAFTYNLGSGDTVDIQVYELLTNDAYYLKSEVYTQSEVNSQISTGVSSYLPLAGGTMTDRPVLNYQNPEIRFEDSDTSNNGEITLDNASLRIESDPDNAVANSTIKFNVDNDTKMIVLSSGNVGIGETNPTDKLVVRSSGTMGGAANTANSYFTITDGTYSLFHDPNEIVSNQAGAFHIAANNAAGELQFQTGGTNARMYIKPDGKVAIGDVANPTSQLHVRGDTNALTGTSVNVSDVQMRIQRHSDTNGGGVALGFLHSTDTSNIGAAVLHKRDGSESVGGLMFATKPDGVGAGGDIPVRMTITSSGRVGLQTTAPEGDLHLHKDNSRVILSNLNSNLTAGQRIEFWEGPPSATATDANAAIEYHGGTSYGGDGAVLIKGQGTNNAGNAANDQVLLSINRNGAVRAPLNPTFTAYINNSGTGNVYALSGSSGVVSGGGTGTLTTVVNRNSIFNTSNGRFTAPVTGVYHVTFNLSLYINGSDGDNSVGWGLYVNGSRFNWRTYDSGLNMSQSTPYVIGQGGNTLGNETEIGAPSFAANVPLTAGDYVHVGWNNMGTTIGIRTFIFSGHLIG